MDVERLMLSAAVSTGSIQDLISRGVVGDHFAQSQTREVYQWACDHLRQYKSSPSVSATKNQFPNLDLPTAVDPLNFYVDEFITATKRRRAIVSIRELAAKVDDPEEVGHIDQSFLHEANTLASLVPGGAVSRFTDAQSRLDRYRAFAKTQRIPGIPSGIPAIDNETMGIQPHHFVVVAGWTGMGKSMLTQYMALRAWEAGKTVLYLSLEMEADAIFRRMDALGSGVPLKSMREGNLTDKQIAQWSEWAERTSSLQQNVIVMDDIGRCTHEQVFAEMNRWKPDVTFIDYLGLMSMPSRTSDWSAMMELTRSLKQITRTLKSPIVAIAQTNRDSGKSANKAVSLDLLAQSISVGQDADLVLGLERDEEMIDNSQMTVRVVKNRDGRCLTADMYWDLEKAQIRPWKAADMFAQKAREVEDETADPVVPFGPNSTLDAEADKIIANGAHVKEMIRTVA